MNVVLFIIFTLLCVLSICFSVRKKRLAAFFSDDFETFSSFQDNVFLQLLQKHERKIAAAILLLGIFIRICGFWAVPDGLNQDEASAAYDAYADLTYGMDRNGDHNPVYSVAWGSGHSSLFLTLSKPWIALFGLNVFTARMTNVLFGCFALFAFWGIMKRYCRPFACVGLFLFAICPQHIMMCRWGLDCNLFPNVFLLALYVLLRATEKPSLYPFSLFLFGLSLYAYGASYITVPIFLFLCAIYLLKQKKITWKMLWLSLAAFVICALPICIFMAINLFGLPELRLGFLNFPRLVSGRYNSTVTVLGGNVWNSICKNLFVFCKIVFLQEDGLIWNSIPGFGTLYLFSAPFLLLGIVRIVRRSFRRECSPQAFVCFLLIASLVLGAVSELNINRANVIFLPLLFALTEGIGCVLLSVKHTVFLVLTTYLCAFSLFCGSYFGSCRAQIGRAFFDGAGEAIVYASQKTDGTVYLTDLINAPYIFVLFYEKTNPQLFLSTVDYIDPNSECRLVRSFDRYITGIPEEENRPKNAAYVLDITEAYDFSDEEYDFQSFGYYLVATQKQR